MHRALRLFTLSILGLAACSTGSKDGSSGADTAAADVFTQVITLDSESPGDLSCYSGGGADWLSETPDPTCQVTAAVGGIVEDFDTGDGVPDATIDIYYADTVGGSIDSSMVTDSSGYASGAQAPTCTPLSYEVYTDPALDDTKVTIEAHQIFDPLGKGDAAVDTSFNSVSSDTYAIIPSLLGISVDPELGIIAGTAYGCDGEKLEGVQVIARTGDGSYPESQETRYFIEDFPNRDQPSTSPDGLWIAINVPPGRVTIELWAYQGGAPVQIGATELDVVADSINISNIKVGYGDGVFYPESCLSACQ